MLALVECDQKLGGEDTSFGGAAGSVSTGLMHATPGEMKSFRSSALRIALMARFFMSSLFHREDCEDYGGKWWFSILNVSSLLQGIGR